MPKAHEVWNQLKAIDELVVESASEGRKAADAVLALLRALDTPPPDLLAFGAQVDGTAWRALGAFEAARQCYDRAEAIYREALRHRKDFRLRCRLILGQAKLYRRWSFLCLERCEWERGLAMLGHAEVCFTAAGRRHEVGHVHLARGQLLWERTEPGDRDRALECLSRAVELVDPAKSAVTFRAAEHNLTSAMTLHSDPDPDSLERAFEALQRGRLSAASKRPSNRHRSRQRFGHRELTVPDAKQRFLQGKVLVRLCQHEDARPFLETARLDLMALGNYPRDVFAITLDLAECYLWIFRRPWQRVAALLTETFALCPAQVATPETRAALQLLEAALESQSLQAARQHLDTARRQHATRV